MATVDEMVGLLKRQILLDFAGELAKDGQKALTDSDKSPEVVKKMIAAEVIVNYLKTKDN